MSQEAELIIEGKSIKLPSIEGTEHEKALDISALRAQSGYVTLDIGYKNTGATQSAITFLDGEKGILHYRGYSIEQLAEKSNFLEVAYLLIYGELPTTAQYEEFNKSITAEYQVPDAIKVIIKAIPQEAHPMGVLAGLISMLTSYYPETTVENASADEVKKTIVKLLGKLPTLSAYLYKHSLGQEFVEPRADLDYCANFVNMMFSENGKAYSINPVVVDAVNKLLILHADHEQNCSTSTVRIVGSAHASLPSSVSAGISALWGPLHGGANQAVIEMLEDIKKDGGDTKKFLAKAKDKNDTFRLMGFGHRVYKNFDPRAKIIKKACDEILKALGVNDPVLSIAKGLEEEALADQYFVDRKLYPNVDFYSGIIYKALGLKAEFFTVLFALGRLPGWTAQWKEMREANEPIGRPRQIYTGKVDREYVEISKR
ncbi:MAG: citrate synthase [Cytophagaceae bacterium]|nr:citrate synthase [Cytophagaceae bacterium]